ncbi:hypothetical protein SLS55_001307 [Diplodia seriata]|uniref:DUF7580 domain-containing protein n=1 Tax=Diplodia seriata TaxID=420778 RepID=A0ABR3CWQ7_9PEZI
MSGIEVAGLVLGALPLIIHAITVYADGVSTVERYFKYEIPLRNLHRALEAEYVIYQNTCEELLNGIVEGNEQRAALLDKPGGPDWAKPALEERLKQRLSRAYTAYIGTMESMKDTISGIEALLKLDKTGKVQLHPSSKFRKEYHRLRFSLKKSEYDGLVSQIQQLNTRLRTLTQQTLALETSRSKHQIPDLDLIRNYATAAYNVICAGLKCGCRSTHGINLRLEGMRKFVSGSVQTPDLSQIQNLCQTICSIKSTCIGTCLGYLEDEITKQTLSLHQSQKVFTSRNTPSILSLHSVLTSNATGRRRFSAAHRLRLAVLLSTNLLQLYRTPWLTEIWDHNDITFFESTGDDGLKDPFISRIPHHGSLADSGVSVPPADAIVLNKPIFALGILLIELCLGKPFEDLRDRGNAGKGRVSAASDFAVASQLLEEVTAESGDRYADAVRRCIRCAFDTRKIDLDDEQFRRAVYQGVVAPLEENLRDFTGLAV